MPGKAIGKRTGYGYPGTVARMSDAVISAYPAKGGDIGFGDPVVLNADGTVSKFGSASTANQFIGVAVREVKQAKRDEEPAFYYKEGEPVDVLVRGSIAVSCPTGAPALRSAVHVKDGAFTATATGAVKLNDNVIFTKKDVDPDKVTEITVLTRNA